MARVFLAAEWRYLVMLNYEVDPALLEARIPPGTELDLFQGRAFVSLVGFRFLNTRLLGISIPLHRDFDEVNLRFYVRRCDGDVVKRGVVFIQEIVPRRAIAAVARWVYHENYRALPMSHVVIDEGAGPRVEYRWRLGDCWNRLAAAGTGAARAMVEGSLEQFIAEHYWGYCAQPDGSTMEYQVAHAPWRVWGVASAKFSGDAQALYGPDFAAILNRQPGWAILAEGSPVTVYAGTKFAC
jgi:uncharacterized protein YqjF (DUF2071 family)